MTLTYPNHPGAKVGGTSQDAADAMAEHALTVRERVDALFDKHKTLTADEAARCLGLNILTVRPRCSELRRLNRIEDAGQRRCNESGMTATALRRKARPGQQELF